MTDFCKELILASIPPFFMLMGIGIVIYVMKSLEKIEKLLNKIKS